jgi:glutathione S-transferase
MLSWGQYVNIDISRWPALARYADKISEHPAAHKCIERRRPYLIVAYA